VCGLSNISFGLPERAYVNTAFLTMAIASGLTMAIANPSQELLMNAAFASDMLLARPESDIRYIERMNYISEKRAAEEEQRKARLEAELRKTQENIASGAGADSLGTGTGTDGANVGDALSGGAAKTIKSDVYNDVLKGNKSRILDDTKKLLAAGEAPDAIINGHLIPAINEVGDLFDKQKYFLPQLISSANAMKLAIEHLEPMLEKEGQDEKATVVVATVEGDIHDIGKNLVVLMLKNYGYRVIDLGKDVPAQTIVDTAIKENAGYIGLSALMTTTMMRMKEVVELVKETGCRARVVIGGAATTESFAEEIGADGYSKDAAECVRLIERLG
jgi:5-methyltetrahydrofolate--homocysteine methyltransferase